MFTKFLNLDSEKQDRILNAAMHEFARSGFDRASTNEIVKEADISKGLLFHYFTSKKHLYLFLYDHCIELLMNETFAKLDMDDPDFFNRLQQTSQLKLNIQHQYPPLFQYFESVYVETSTEVRNEIEARNLELSNISIAKIFAGIDLSKFKEGADFNKVLKVILWTFEGFGKEELEKARKQSTPLDYDKIFAETEDYIELFKQCFYK
ncbi:TetR/AcrR family transcriptional regulator [Paenibacillus sp. FA6]|uniref:TetR/AcrR family transcriptional regulator n=1 Tax=Paenibacillus sp. FA6 TaxID=3413029 RepID=UPI003F6575BF